MGNSQNHNANVSRKDIKIKNMPRFGLSIYEAIKITIWQSKITYISLCFKAEDFYDSE
jgi:hypothetical protein